MIIAPRVSVIIPTKYRIDLFESCLEGLGKRTGYSDLEVIVVDNGVSDRRFHRILERNAEGMNLKKVVDFGKFNFSRLINLGAARATGDVLLLLNDDVVALEQGWLHRLVEDAIREDIGAVGARLQYPDGSIQHAGVALGIGNVSGHLWKGTSKEEAAANPYICLPGSRMAVTGACLAVRRQTFESVGGFDERFAVALNDIDFCLRLHAIGYRNIYRGDAVLTHFESQSRGLDDTSIAKRRRLASETREFLARWKPLIEDDPFFSPAFDPMSETGIIHPAALSPKPYKQIADLD